MASIDLRYAIDINYKILENGTKNIKYLIFYTDFILNILKYIRLNKLLKLFF